eukprot:CAMPEP_0113888120 /NCGR_PEP_ID=MMETSP0780_2-20120614/12652_1 /TAXON_ID=652834 /ORGANISM="Palpitomonas bilix" /LENGTH=83 /DNA_ID=CAMNT_0000876847 /DNA_START=311 /DNA_END=562 /DNA_ORIENTATION=- /assembly_acc=CAM_ASM_000599
MKRERRKEELGAGGWRLEGKEEGGERSSTVQQSTVRQCIVVRSQRLEVGALEVGGSRVKVGGWRWEVGAKAGGWRPGARRPGC